MHHQLIHGGASKQHAKFHGVTVGQCYLDRPAAPAQGEQFKAVGRVLRAGRGTAFAEGELLNERGSLADPEDIVFLTVVPQARAAKEESLTA